MSDSDDLDLDGGAEAAGVNTSKKKSSFSLLLPSLLKFIAIGLGALIFIVTVVVLTFNIMNRSGRPQVAVFDPASPYIGRRPEFAHFNQIGVVTTRTRDPSNISVTVEMIISYDMGDNAALSELMNRQYELRDFVRRFFSNRYASELTPAMEDQLRREIMEQLNTRILHTARARQILFNRLDVMEMW